MGFRDRTRTCENPLPSTLQPHACGPSFLHPRQGQSGALACFVQAQSSPHFVIWLSAGGVYNSLNMTSLLPVLTMSVNVTVYMYRRRRALESKD